MASVIAHHVVTADEYRDVVGRFASGVTVITTSMEGVPIGATASAVSSLSLEPPMLLICLKHDSKTGQAVASTGRFAVNVLGEDHGDLAVRFASPIEDRFAGVRVEQSPGGLALLADAIAAIECRVVETVPGGTHLVFLGEVEHVSSATGAPLAYFRGKFGRLELSEDAGTVRELRRRVMARDLPVGEPIDLDRLVEDMQIPRGTAYRTLSALAESGLVDRDINGRFRVPPITLQGLLESASARTAIFCGAAIQAAAVASEHDLHAVHDALEKMSGISGDSGFDFESWYSARRALVESLAELVGAPALLDAFDRADVAAQIFGLWSSGGAPRTADLAAIRRGYVDIVEASQNGELDRLPGIMRDLSERYTAVYTEAFAEIKRI